MSNREKDPTLTKPLKLKTYNWPEIADKFLADLYDEDYITREHIPDIATDFRLEYKLNKEFAYLYIDKAVRKRLGWLPCIVCGKTSVMQTGENPPKFYCGKHIPPYKIQHREKVETDAESQYEIESRLYSFALNFLFKYQDPGKKILRSELIKAMDDYIEHFSLKYNDVQKIADKAILEFREKSRTTPEFKTAYQELYKTEEKISEPATIDKIDPGSDIKSIDKISNSQQKSLIESTKTIDKIDPGSDIKSIDKISNSQQKSLIESTKSIDKIDLGSDIESIDKTPIDPFDSKLQVLKNQKGIQIRYRTCGKKTCKCASKREEDMHGPYIYKIEWNPQRKKQIWKYQGKYEC